jgi:single-strand DNA-binding protein
VKAHGLARLGRDAEVRYTPAGKTVCSLSLAFDVRGREGKETTWVDAALWGERAESLAPYLLKGTMHMFDLSDVRIETWENDRGSGSKLVANVVDVTLGPKRGDDDSQQTRQQTRQQTPQTRQAPPQRQQAPQGRTQAPQRQQAPRGSSGFDDMDDDIPF